MAILNITETDFWSAVYGGFYMLKRLQKLYIGICLVMLLLLAGCSDTGGISHGQETDAHQEMKSNQETVSGQATESSQTAESSQETSVESTESLIRYEVADAWSRNCYQAFYSLVSKSKITEWAGFQLMDIDGDKCDELIAAKEDAESIKQGKQRYFVMDWADRKIIVTETDPLTETPSGEPLNQLEYYDKDFILLILSAEGKSFMEGVTKKDKDFFYLVASIVWVEEGWTEKTQEQREGMEDYLVVSELGERTNSSYHADGIDDLLYQYKMRTSEVTEFYKDVMGWEREYSPDHDSTSEIGVQNRSNGYLYGQNKIGWADYPVLTKVEHEGSELTVHAIIKSAYTDNRIAEVKVLMAPNAGKYGYELQGYEVAREEDVDLRTGQKLQEFQAEDLRMQYVMQRNRYSDEFTPLIRTLCFQENDTEQFTANAKRLLTELKKEYEANPGKDGSNLAAKSTLLASYDFADHSKILIYEDAVYGKVPPETGEGSEYGYYLNYCVLTPGDMRMDGELFHYTESFGDMPADRHGKSRCYHYFLGCDLQGDPKIDGAYVAHTADFAEELMFYAEIGRSHDMTMDENGWENYDEDFYVYGAYFRPDGTRILGQYDTWQIATWEYVSHGFFLKDSKEKTLFEQKPGPEGFEYYVEGKKLAFDQKQEDTEETFCDMKLDAKTRLIGKFYYWEWEGLVSVDLVYDIDGAEVHHNLFWYKTMW